MKTIVLTFDDACRSQLEYAVPLLKKYGFGATFFISLPECWNEIPGAHLSKQEISGFYEQGFELGNHTMNHPDMRRLDDAGCREEISIMDRIIRESGAPSPVSFAYPGGPFAGNAAKLLPEFGIRYARTTEHELWRKETDPLRIPCFSVCNKEAEHFQKGLKLLEGNEDSALVLLYHGVPDIAHEHCTTDPELFAEHMKYLYDNGYRVLSMADCGNSFFPPEQN
jgi:peptidoglycan/xylan/chitin deacetylase (PgdA/CDA1 family)